eukprot:2261186-Rhodomonas_salina.1
MRKQDGRDFWFRQGTPATPRNARPRPVQFGNTITNSIRITITISISWEQPGFRPGAVPEFEDGPRAKVLRTRAPGLVTSSKAERPQQR